MRLWLDDERDPKDQCIQERFGAEGDEFWVKNAAQAIHYLRQGNVSFISLDHDLGPGAGTGTDVAKFIEEQAFLGTLPRLEWDLHTMNPVGRKEMGRAMRNADISWGKHESEATK